MYLQLSTGMLMECHAMHRCIGVLGVKHCKARHARWLSSSNPSLGVCACSASPCCCKVDGLDGTIPAALLALEQQVHQLNTLTLNKR